MNIPDPIKEINLYSKQLFELTESLNEEEQNKIGFLRVLSDDLANKVNKFQLKKAQTHFFEAATLYSQLVTNYLINPNSSFEEQQKLVLEARKHEKQGKGAIFQFTMYVNNVFNQYLEKETHMLN